MNPTNSIVIQQVAAQAGYHLTASEISLISAVAGALVHIAHQIYDTPGGLLAILKQFTGLGQPKPETPPTTK